MKRHFSHLLLLTSFVLLFSSCATIFCSKSSKVKVYQADDVEFLVDGKPPIKGKKEGTYLIPKNKEGVQVELKKEGSKPYYTYKSVVKVSPLIILNLFNVFGIGADLSVIKAWQYEKEWYLKIRKK